ncbi:MAG: hypothetical protein WGN25_04600 [Candidatus Electrothrix sp. GW3-4]|uniref:hypothetical protein n=1 Tax=Candidatus Electrothrix sp. GW3-4 TaxID=3126740 RepID=UPI0030D243E7
MPKIYEVLLMKCRLCKQSISDGAKKCHHCQSWLDWKRFFSNFALIFSAVTLLLSASGVLLAPTIGLLLGKKPKLEAILLKSTINEFKFMITNAGNAVIGIKEICIINNLNDIDDNKRIFSIAEDQWGKTISCNKSFLLIQHKRNIKTEWNLPVFYDKRHNINMSTSPCTLRIEYFNLSTSESDSKNFDFKCYKGSIYNIEDMLYNNRAFNKNTFTR